MSLPGTRLHHWASRLLSAESMQRVIDPAVADLQAEYAEARLTARPWTRWRICLAGATGILNAVLQQALSETWGAVVRPSEKDRRLRADVAAFSVIALLLVTCLLAGRPSLLLASHLTLDQWWVIPILVPQALPLSIPVALVVGIVVAVGGRRLSFPVTVTIVAFAIAASTVSFAVAGWVAPAANQAFRIATAPANADLRKGTNELTLGELRAARHAPLYEDFYGDRLHQARTAMRYYARLALPAAPVVLTVLVLALRPGRSSRRWRRALAGLAVCGAYYTLMLVGQAGVVDGTMPALVGAWLPNFAFGTLAIATLALRCRTADVSAPDV